ncbi:MAG: tetratricopeptide repeat protein [Magnetococcales bacterium]|nr:tetratricopeptide repeat protein [Magnetococcales bacterium]
METPDPALEHALNLFRSNRLEEAWQFLQQLLRESPESASVRHLLGLIHLQRGENAAALPLLQGALQREADNPLFHGNLALTLHRLGRVSEALHHFRQALRLHPPFADAHNNLGLLLREMGQEEEAMACFETALTHQPEHGAAWNNRGLGYLARKDPASAEACFQRALEARPGDPEAATNLGLTLRQRGCLAEARHLLSQVLAVFPDFLPARINLALVFTATGEIPRAESQLRAILAREPQHREARWNLSHLLLLQKAYGPGWVLYESRLEFPEFQTLVKRHALPLWQGERVGSEGLLLWTEQGYGDAIQFVRWLPQLLLREPGARLVLETPAALHRLFVSLDQRVTVVIRGESPPPCRWQLPLMSLPLRMQLEGPPPAPYLQPPAMGNDCLLPRRDPATRRVGLVWAGSGSHADDRARSLPVSLLEELLAVGGIDWVSLQLPEPEEALPVLQRHPRLLRLGPRLADFAATAAVLAGLDLLIAVDTATAHLAGAMGRPVWLLTPYVPDWRWGLIGERSDWYPSLRLFRQPGPEAWPELIRQVVGELSAWKSD